MSTVEQLSSRGSENPSQEGSVQSPLGGLCFTPSSTKTASASRKLDLHQCTGAETHPASRVGSGTGNGIRPRWPVEPCDVFTCNGVPPPASALQNGAGHSGSTDNFLPFILGDAAVAGSSGDFGSGDRAGSDGMMEHARSGRSAWYESPAHSFDAIGRTTSSIMNRQSFLPAACFPPTPLSFIAPLVEPTREHMQIARQKAICRRRFVFCAGNSINEGKVRRQLILCTRVHIFSDLVLAYGLVLFLFCLWKNVSWCVG